MQKKLLLSTSIIFLLCSLTFLSVQTNNYSNLIVYASGTADSYGNRILGFWCAEYNETLSDYQFPYGQCKYAVTYNGSNTFDVFNILASAVGVTLLEYNSGVELKIYDNRKLILYVVCAANKTLISNPQTDMRVYLNITGVVSNQLMTFYSYSIGLNFYKATFEYEWTSNLPSAGQAYNVAIKYEVYY